MARNLLLSGPAGAAKSEEAKARLRSASEPTIAADFQSITAALMLLERDAEGRYPVRPAWILPLAEYARRSIITAARGRDIAIVATNSDGDPERRKMMLDLLGPDADEEIIDPGEDIVRARLSSRKNGKLSRDCSKAINRWYGRGGGRRR